MHIWTLAAFPQKLPLAPYPVPLSPPTPPAFSTPAIAVPPVALPVAPPVARLVVPLVVQPSPAAPDTPPSLAPMLLALLPSSPEVLLAERGDLVGDSCGRLEPVLDMGLIEAPSLMPCEQSTTERSSQLPASPGDMIYIYMYMTYSA